MSDYRREQAYQLRLNAAQMAKDREHPAHYANGDEQRYATANYAMSFTKGLDHSAATGLIEKREDFEAFRQAIDEGFMDPFTTQVPVPLNKGRAWESPTAGIVYELEGPDPQAVTMPPAPALGSDELAYELAEVYELALLRDYPLTDFVQGTDNAKITDTLERLNNLAYSPNNSTRPRKTECDVITAQTLFRGSSPKVEVGPYLSQLLVIGNEQPGCSDIAHGYIQYGALRIDQRVPVANPKDYLTEESSWLSSQNGEDLRDNSVLFDGAKRRFISTPRDLATYVHDDALYEAYLNACLILLSMKSVKNSQGKGLNGAPFDPGFAKLSGESKILLNKASSHGASEIPRAAGGFALHGGPHILTLVTEVATRALKAVRYQKFNTHIRLRPEALAARVQYAKAIESAHPQVGSLFSNLKASIHETVKAIEKHNATDKGAKKETAFLPMAFQEGSPMHPSYGAGHATVAGACVTILKAFFDTSAVFIRRDGKELFARYQSGDQAVQYVPDAQGLALIDLMKSSDEKKDGEVEFLTLEGELNKLAANISIGRNMAGVHYYSDYYDSLRMGEKIAIEILREQSLCYPTDAFILTVPTFDGEVIKIGAR